ncbi:MAG TPA: DUF72 domain-containing protein [Verrucomicrobiae bacterium]|nr:DUF72 domain-containing protein [Verrucomicrobiae bacterium]
MEHHVATSGWYYREWKGAFYPDDLASHRWFRHYASQFNTVELNAPFYRWPKPATVKTWNRNAPENFRYSIKVNRLITHEKRFQGTQDAIREFYQIADVLGPKLGCFLFQLPPNFEFTRDRLELILSQLDPTHRNVLEFRHVSWWTQEVYVALREHKAIFCSVSAPKLPSDLIVTADDLYVRFHGPKRWFYEPYSEEQLADWTARIAASGAKAAWIYFNNTADGSAIGNAFEMRKKLDGIT